MFAVVAAGFRLATERRQWRRFASEVQLRRVWDCNVSSEDTKLASHARNGWSPALSDTRRTVALLDTSPDARAVYIQRLAEMTPAERLRVGVALWQTAWSLQRAAARRRNPQADEAEIVFEIAVSRFGLEFARTAYRRG